MKTRKIALTVVLSLSINCIGFADRACDRAEILQIFQKLTSQPRKTWMAAGTIEATHEEYRAPKTIDQNGINYQVNQRIQEYQSNPNKRELTENLQKMQLDAIPFNVRYKLSNEYTMNSTVVVRYDGDRFYWEINVDSRTDSVRPDADLEGNFMTKQFNLNWNTKRVFVWNGQEYTTYFLPGNQAIVDAAGNTPHVVNGPLTAGLIPWGYGFYSYDNLCSIESSAVEKDIDGQTQIHLALNNPDGSEMLFVMDPEKDYAVISCSITGAGNSIISKQYSGYQQISGNWVPTIIVLERYEAGSNRLLARDLWDFTCVDGNVPGVDGFDVSYETDALVEYYSDLADKPLMYRYSQTVDTDLLLAERLAFVANEGSQPQNCATIALKYTASQLGKEVSDQQLAELVTEPNGDTSLSAMKQFVQGLGLNCRAITTDIDTLKALQDDYQIILHIPGKKHFVVLESIDNSVVRIIDLAGDKFYYRTDINFFGMDWTEGTALLVSVQPIQIQGNSVEIEDGQLQNIIGAAGWSCTRLLQEYNAIRCSYVGGECGGMYQVYFTRYGCEPAESGSCSSYIRIRYAESPCIEDPYEPFACTITYEWTCYYIRACMHL